MLISNKFFFLNLKQDNRLLVMFIIIILRKVIFKCIKGLNFSFRLKPPNTTTRP